jgi:hypothetical protein
MHKINFAKKRFVFKTALVVFSVLIISALAFLFDQTKKVSAQGSTYYVSSTGSDANPGTETKPFKTIQHGVDSISGGDTLFIRDGTYPERVVIEQSKSGTESNPTIISGYPGERPIIDGQDDPSVSSNWNLVLIAAGNIQFKDLEVANSANRGINVYSGETPFVDGQYVNSQTNVVIENVWVHNTKNAGILAEWLDNLTIKDSKFWQNNQINNPESQFNEGCCWSGAISARRGNNFVIQNNEIFESYGEGINIHGGVVGATIEDNVIYDTWAPAVYPINSRDILVRRNLVYHTNDTRFCEMVIRHRELC